ncbi:Hypothetical_protein [Hexamita inflata]|uniref:Hypothetical_protein n=1 Tax=Hexamita inflata TaxID=28002 RepID=A0ABP1HJW1_9EUKA
MTSTQHQISQGIFSNVGFVGFVNGTSTSLNNIFVKIQIQANHGLYIGAITGGIYSNLWQAQNITVNESVITGNGLLGLFSPSTQTGTIIQSSFYSSDILADNQDFTFQGGLIGDTQNSLIVQQCVVSDLSIFSNNTYGWSISAGIIGDTHEYSTLIKQTIVKTSRVQSYGAVQHFVSSAGVIACVYNSITTIQDLQVSNLNLTSSSSINSLCAGLVSKIVNQTIITTNSQISSIQIFGYGMPLDVGIVFCYNSQTIYNISNTQTYGANSINNVPITNCANVITYSQSGC